MSVNTHWLDRIKSIQLPALLPQTELPGPTAPLMDWIKVVSEDPLLAMQIFRYANRMMSNRQILVRTLEHAVALIGSQRLIRITNNIHRVDPDSTAFSGLQSTVGDSLVAASLMRQWFDMRQIPWTEADYWMTLFYDIGLWALWVLEPEVMEGFEQRAENGENRTRLIEEMIGMSVRDWNDELCRHFQLPAIPETITDEETHLIENRVQPHKLAALKFFLPFSHQLAYRVRLSWDDESLDTLCRTGEVALGLTHFRPMLKLWIVKAAREYQLTQAATAARRLLAHQPPVTTVEGPSGSGFGNNGRTRAEARTQSPKRGNASNRAQPAESPGGAKPRPRRSVRLNTVRETRRLFRQRKAWDSREELRKAALNALRQGLGLRRIVVMELKDGCWRAFDSVGCEQHPDLGRLTLELNASPVMQEFARRVTAAWLHPGNRRKAQRQLPANLFAAADEQAFFLRSFSIGDEAPILIYADAKGDPEPLSEPDYRLFREFCADWNTAINRSRQ